MELCGTPSVTHPRTYGISNNIRNNRIPSRICIYPIIVAHLAEKQDARIVMFRSEYTKYLTQISIDTYACCVLGNAAAAAPPLGSSDNKRRSKQRTSFHFHSHQERCKNDLTVNVLYLLITKDRVSTFRNFTPTDKSTTFAPLIFIFFIFRSFNTSTLKATSQLNRKFNRITRVILECQ